MSLRKKIIRAICIILFRVAQFGTLLKAYEFNDFSIPLFWLAMFFIALEGIAIDAIISLPVRAEAKVVIAVPGSQMADDFTEHLTRQSGPRQP
jgi:hypothetical protein